MIRELPNDHYGQFALVLSFFFLLLVMTHLNFHSPIAQMFRGKRESAPDKSALLADVVRCSLKLSAVWGSVPGLLITFIAWRIGYDWFCSAAFGMSLMLYGVFITLSAIARGTGRVALASSTYVLFGLLRLTGAVALVLTGHFNILTATLNYLLPIVFATLLLFLWLNPFGIARAATLGQPRANGNCTNTVSLLFGRAKYVVISDCATTGASALVLSAASVLYGLEILAFVDLILQIMSMISLVVSNTALALIIVANDIGDLKQRIREALAKVLLPVLLVSFLVATALHFTRAHSWLLNQLGISYDISFALLIILAMLVVSQIASILSSGLTQGRGLFRLDGISKLAAFVLATSVCLLFWPVSIEVLVIAILAFRGFHSVLVLANIS